MGDDRGPRLLASCWALVAAAALFLCLRIYCKVMRQKGLWWDDWVMIAAWVALLAAACFNAYLVSLGFGRHMDTISEHNRRVISLQTILVGMFTTFALTLSKTSFCITLLRLLVDSRLRWLLWFIIATVNIGLHMVWIIGFLKCKPASSAWDPRTKGHCWPKEPVTIYGLFAGYYSAAMDILLACLPWKILMNMAMLRRERLGVAVCMSLGVIAGAAGIIRQNQFVSMKSPDITWARVDLTIWGFAESAASIMAASLPVLRMLYREFASNSRRYWQAIRRPSDSFVRDRRKSSSLPHKSKGSGATAAPARAPRSRTRDTFLDGDGDGDAELGLALPAAPRPVRTQAVRTAPEPTTYRSLAGRDNKEASYEMRRFRSR